MMEAPSWLGSSIQSVYAVGLVGLFFYTFAELAIVHYRKRALRLREARMAGLGALSQGAAMAGVAALWRPLSVGVAATAGANLSPLEMGHHPERYRPIRGPGTLWSGILATQESRETRRSHRVINGKTGNCPNLQRA